MESTVKLLKEALEIKLKNTPDGEAVSLLISHHAAQTLIEELNGILDTEEKSNA